MRKRIVAICLLLGVCGLQTTFAQGGLMRKVYLKNDKSFEGELVGVNPDISYTFRDQEGDLIVLDFEEVSKMENPTASENKSTEQNTADNSIIVPEGKEDNKLKIGGSVDIYYQHNLNKQPLPTSFTESHNAFTLGMANIILSKNFNQAGFVADLAVGPRAEVANGYPGTTLSAIKQLYLFYSPFEQLTFTAGNFSTFVGYELINPGDNINYSTSYLFSNGPFYHTGVKMDYSFSESFSWMLGVFNDTDEKIDVTKGKHIGTQLAFIKSNISVFVNYLTGLDGDVPGAEVRGHQFDLTSVANLSNQFSLGLNVSRKINQQQDSPDTDWFGAAIYTNYKVKDFLVFGLRGEYIDDPDGIISGADDGNIYSFTFSTNLKYQGLTLIPEFRIDRSNDPIFQKNENEFSDSSMAMLMALIYAF